ncbi:MAG: Gfo/Idh/MocA family oxidoreductase [Magnetococcales bacterium]|nr:Gfo/Idh/MocA family oxidoreductase [Magnetococcales bacterium]
MNTSVAVIGCGYWGRNLVRNFAATGALAAVSDSNDEVASRLAAEHGVPARDYAAVLADPAIVAVAIATPAESHARMVEDALLAGKHVFVEKPLALKVADAERLTRLADQRGRILMVGHLLQYHPAFLTLKSMCEKGDLGRIRYVYSNRLNLGKFRTEENILWSFAPHDISMILALLPDQLESVSAVGHCYLHKAVADVTTTHMTFASGQAAHIHVSWLHPFKEQRLVVIGDSAMAVFDDRLGWDSKLSIYPHQVKWKDNVPEPAQGECRPVPLDPAEPLKLECQSFVDCVAAGIQPRTDGAEGLRVLRVLDAAQRSMETGQTVSFVAPAEAPPRDYFVHPTAEVDTPAKVGAGTKIWHFSHVLQGSTIGTKCNIGQNVVIGPDAVVGNNCKIQNNVSVYTGVTLEDGVFCGPSMVFTNVVNPRAEIERKSEYRPTLVKRGATIGANATVVCGHTVGRYALIGAGAVVTRDVPDHALMVGNPARRLGWVCRCGIRLADGAWTETTCPSCGETYRRDTDRDFVSPVQPERAQ